ncbi:MAG: hypothetical protein QM817_21270 [Archangium sp.]
MSATCPLHQRPSEQTCARCGVFLCDWCVKLAPDWGAGLCSDCVRHTAPKTPVVRASFGASFLVAFLVLSGISAFVSFVLGLWNRESASQAIGSAVWAVVAIGGAIVIIRNARR